MNNTRVLVITFSKTYRNLKSLVVLFLEVKSRWMYVFVELQPFHFTVDCGADSTSKSCYFPIFDGHVSRRFHDHWKFLNVL